jgi:Spy/CpxP family protein refolding chaperone
MSWIRMAIAGAAFIGVASVAGAQAPQGGPPQGGDQRGRGMRGEQMLFQGIDLTDAQKDQISKIREKYRAEREALRPKDAGGAPDGGRPQNDDATRQKMDAIRTKSNAEYRAVLTPAQQAIFDKNVADMKARMDQWQKGGKPQGDK